ncbi:MAG: hypothetical protein IJU94_04975 [Clostridia bacterium]|nr:hypothetical protein [Clostridia bacterium]
MADNNNFYRKGKYGAYGRGKPKNKPRLQRRRTTREESHSAESNTRLTLIALLGAIGFAGVFAALALREKLGGAFVPVQSACALALLASLALFSSFRR